MGWKILKINLGILVVLSGILFTVESNPDLSPHAEKLVKEVEETVAMAIAKVKKPAFLESIPEVPSKPKRGLASISETTGDAKKEQFGQDPVEKPIPKKKSGSTSKENYLDSFKKLKEKIMALFDEKSIDEIEEIEFPNIDSEDKEKTPLVVGGVIDASSGAVKVRTTTSSGGSSSSPVSKTPKLKVTDVEISSLEDYPISVEFEDLELNLDSCEVTVHSDIQVTQPCACSGKSCLVDFLPILNANGLKELTYTLKSGTQTATANLRLNITPENDEPTITTISDVYLKTDGSVNLAFAISDVDSTITCSQVDLSTDNNKLVNSDFTITGSTDCNLVVKSAGNYNGPVTLTLQIGDGELFAEEEVVINLISVQSIDVKDLKTKVPRYYKQPLKLQVTYSDSTVAEMQSQAIWSSTNSNTISTAILNSQATGTAVLSVSHKGLTDSETYQVQAWNNLTLSTNNINLSTGASSQVFANVTLSDGGFFEVGSSSTWSSDDSAIASIINGNAVGHQTGTTKIKATFGGQEAESKVEVNSKVISSFDIVGESDLIVFETSRYKAQVTYSDSSTEDVTNSTLWVGSNDQKLTVSNSEGTIGQVTALGSGSVSLQARFGTYQSQKNILITQLNLMSIVVTPANRLSSNGQKISYKAKGVFSDGSEADITDKVSWSTNTTTNTQFISTGEIQVNYTGTTSATVSVTASLDGVTSSTNLYINPSTVSSISISPSLMLKSGESYGLKAFANLADGGVVEITHLAQWSSSSPSSLTVSNSSSNRGTIFGVSPGTSTVSATYSGVTGTKSVTVQATSTVVSEEGNGITAQYYSGMTLTTLRGVRTDAQINFDWNNSVNAPLGLKDAFSVRWTGKVKAQSTQNYYFCTDSDDGIRVYINNVLVINNWTNHGLTRNCSGAISMTAGTKYPVVVEFYENSGEAVVKFLWGATTGSQSFVPKSVLYTD